MKKVLSTLVLCVLALFSTAGASQLGVIVLNTLTWSGGHLPSDWQIKVTHGRPDITTCGNVAASCLHLKSEKASFALEHSVDVNPQENRFLTWRWRVTQLPAGGDFRKAGTDDQAAQLLVAFADRRVLTYIWDSSAPKGTAQLASSIPLVHIFAVVCESGNADLNQWLTETRDVAADYEHAYGKPAPQVKGLRIQINSQHTGTVAESFFGEVAFRSAPQ